jgi:hypothetical protein
MNIRHRILSVIGAFILTLGTVVSAFAQTSGQSTVAITSDDATHFLAVTITTANFEARPFSFDQQTTSGSLSLAVTDTRGTATGWGVSLAGTDFSALTGETFAITNLSVAPGTPQAVTGQCGAITSNANQSVVPIAQMQTNTQRIWTAASGAGSGCYTLTAGSTLGIPGGTLVGTYVSTITVSISSAP